MALIKCPECGSEISSEAARCPNCGVPAEVWVEEISSSYSPPVASKNNSEEKHIVERCEESKGKGRFNKIIAAIVIVLLVALLGVAALKLTSNHLIGRSKSEAEYRSAVYAHITDSHGEAIDSYDSFVLSDNGEAYITVSFKAALEMGGYLNAQADLVLDDECNIISCSFCDTFGSHAGKSDEPTSENWDWDDGGSTLYQEFILRKTEQLTGFVISLEMDNYEEHEIVENGHAYIDVFAFINIEEMAGTPIDVGSVFQLYALINPDNEEDLFIVITGNSTGEIYRYDNTSIPHETVASSSGSNYEDSSNSLSYEKQLFTVFLHSTYNGYEMSVTAEQGEAMPACDPPYGDSTVKFMGYFSGENGSGTQYYDENMNSVHNWDKTSDGELYAYWLKDYSITPENFQDYFEVRITGQRIGDDVLTLDYEIVPKSNFDWNGAESSDTISATMRIDVTADLSQSGCDSSYDTQITIDFNLMKSDQYMYSGTEALTFPSTWGCYTTPTITQCAGSVEKIW